MNEELVKSKRTPFHVAVNRKTGQDRATVGAMPFAKTKNKLVGSQVG